MTTRSALLRTSSAGSRSALTRSAVAVLGGAALVQVVVETPDGIASVPVLLVRSDDRWLIRTVLADQLTTGAP